MKAFLVTILLRLLAATWRVRVIGSIPDYACVVAFWHGTMLPVWYAFRKQRPVGLCSASNDGAMLASLLSAWKYTVVRGSSSRGGSKALAAMVDALREQQCVLITPDGPRGPARVAKAGAVVAAIRTGTSVIPVTVRLYAARTLSSWDSFAIPMPFSRIDVVVHSAISPTSSGTHDVAELCLQLTTVLGPA